MPFCCTDALASVSPVQLFFADFLLNWLVVDSSFELLFFQMFSWLFELSWPEFERVCKVSRANSIWIELLTQESLLIVRSRTKNYKTLTKSSVLHLLVTFESRIVLDVENWVHESIDRKFWGVSFHISYETYLAKIISFKTHVSRIRSSLITETYRLHLRA